MGVGALRLKRTWVNDSEVQANRKQPKQVMVGSDSSLGDKVKYKVADFDVD